MVKRRLRWGGGDKEEGRALIGGDKKEKKELPGTEGWGGGWLD
jgi:hypothetical protein